MLGIEGLKFKVRVEKYWYKTYVYECPCCGAGKTIKEREYGPKPTNPNDRVVFIDRWCGNTC